MPIIKSIGRKDSNFKQLVHYIFQEGAQSFAYLHNITGVLPNDLDGIIQAFKDNNTFRRKRKNGVGQYHEVVSFSPKDNTYLQTHPEVLEGITRVYIGLRAPNSIACATIHYDKKHIHIHCIISPNEYQSKKSTRLSKKEFHTLKQTIEQYQAQYYPLLNQSIIQGRIPRSIQTIQRQCAKELNIHNKDKRMLSATLKSLLYSTKNLQEVQDILRPYNISTYTFKGRVQGLLYNNKKYRFSRLLPSKSPNMDIIRQWQQPQEKQQEIDDTLLDLI